MNDYEFILRFRLPNATEDGDQYLDALFEAGCDDATVGVGIPGTIALDFCRQADSTVSAIQSAISDVLSAIPGATLVEAGPDLPNLTDLFSVD